MDTNQYRPKSDEVIPCNMNQYRSKTEEITPTHTTEQIQRPIQVINSIKRPNHRDKSGIPPKKLRFAPETMPPQIPYQQYQPTNI